MQTFIKSRAISKSPYLSSLAKQLAVDKFGVEAIK